MKRPSSTLLLLSILSVAILCLGGCGRKPTPSPAIISDSEPTIAPSPTLQPSPTTELTPTPEPTPRIMAEYTPEFTSSECTFTIPAGALVDCGYLIVPEDRYGDPTDTIRVYTAIYRSISPNPAPDPIIFITGGPGGEAIEWSATTYAFFITPFLADRDFIVFDPRGVGRSDPPLDCPSLALVYLRDLQEDLSGQEREDLYVDALEGCRDGLIGQGANLQAYTSAAVAGDIADLAAVLGYDQVNLYGASYGARMAQAAMRDYPDTVRSAILDSAVPLDINLYNEKATNTNRALNQLFDACSADPECAATYPDLEQTFFRVVDRFYEQPLEIGVPNPFVTGTELPIRVSGSSVINMVMWSGYWSQYDRVPQAIYDIDAGDYAVLERFVPMAMLDAYQDVSIGERISVECHEQVFTTSPDELEARFAEYPHLERSAYGAVFGTKDALFSICDLWDAAPFDLHEVEPLTSDIPTLILAGEYDPTTPLIYGERVASTLSNAQMVVFPGVGHTPGAVRSGECARLIAVQFLANPLAQADTSCIDAMPDIDFALPLTSETVVHFTTFEVPEMNLTGQIPADWEPIGSNFYNRSASSLDPTQIGIHSVSIDVAGWVTWLTIHFAGDNGFDSTPELIGTFEENGRTWQHYQTTYRDNPVDLALTDTGSTTWMAVMVSLPAERDVLFEIVFLPVIRSIDFLN